MTCTWWRELLTGLWGDVSCPRYLCSAALVGVYSNVTLPYPPLIPSSIFCLQTFPALFIMSIDIPRTLHFRGFQSHAELVSYVTKLLRHQHASWPSCTSCMQYRIYVAGSALAVDVMAITCIY
eukprot:1138272-Pelagomonas_calceolata.AAC.1